MRSRPLCVNAMWYPPSSARRRFDGVVERHGRLDPVLDGDALDDLAVLDGDALERQLLAWVTWGVTLELLQHEALAELDLALDGAPRERRHQNLARFLVAHGGPPSRPTPIASSV